MSPSGCITRTGNHRSLSSYSMILAQCVAGGVATGWCFTVSVPGNNFNPLVLFLPAVAEIASLIGMVGGLLVSPIVYFGLCDRAFSVRLAVFGFMELGTMLLTWIAPAGFFYTPVALLIVGVLIARRLSHPISC